MSFIKASDLVHGCVLVEIDGVPGHVVHDAHGVQVAGLSAPLSQPTRQQLDYTLNISHIISLIFM